ncbi:MAG: hypothetical protein NC548_11185 [Lachnospiraceae bacterium]|nr:hypothetical protein [Lachnospiraceae bacterium]
MINIFKVFLGDNQRNTLGDLNGSPRDFINAVTDLSILANCLHELKGYNKDYVIELYDLLMKGENPAPFTVTRSGDQVMVYTEAKGNFLQRFGYVHDTVTGDCYLVSEDKGVLSLFLCELIKRRMYPLPEYDEILCLGYIFANIRDSISSALNYNYNLVSGELCVSAVGVHSDLADNIYNTVLNVGKQLLTAKARKTKQLISIQRFKQAIAAFKRISRKTVNFIGIGKLPLFECDYVHCCLWSTAYFTMLRVSHLNTVFTLVLHDECTYSVGADGDIVGQLLDYICEYEPAQSDVDKLVAMSGASIEQAKNFYASIPVNMRGDFIRALS